MMKSKLQKKTLSNSKKIEEIINLIKEILRYGVKNSN